MLTKTTAVMILAMFLNACASIYGTPEQRREKNAALSDYTLCENLTVATLAPQLIRNEWALELQQRGADCRKYSDILNNVVKQRDSSMSNSLQLLQQQANPAKSTSNGTTCFKKSEWSSGFNKNCVYDCLGSDAVQTISAVELCPLTIVR